MAWLCCGPTRGALLSTSSAEARPHRLRDRSAAKASKHLDQHVRFPWRASHAREVSADPQSTRHAERTYRCCGVAQRAARSSPRRRPSLDPTESTTDRRQGIRNVVLTAFEYRGARPARILPRVSSTDRPRNTRLRVCHANGGCALEATACTSHHGLAPRERDLPPMQYSSIVRAPITASAARRARAASLRVLPPPERQPAQWRARACHVKAGCELEATVRTSHHGLEPKEIGLPKVQYHYVVRSTITTSAAQHARESSSRVSPPPEKQPAQ